MSAIIPFIEGCFIISHDSSIHPMRRRADGATVPAMGLRTGGRCLTGWLAPQALARIS